MARAYSQDLRDRAINTALAGTPARRVAARFGIGDATAITTNIAPGVYTPNQLNPLLTLPGLDYKVAFYGMHLLIPQIYKRHLRYDQSTSDLH